METALGEFFAIFDADFLPKADFLKQTIPFFDNVHVGVVQTRWGHLNENYSLLTRLQAFQLNVHFTIEQKGRQAAGLPLQFNGTAGVWRKTAILDAGGWQSDTLTEDLDLSYRAQLRGWKIHYVESIEAPAELPADMEGIKSQQYRWMKGGAETARNILPLIWKSSLPLRTKLFASHHLLSSAVFVFVFVTGITSVPLLFMLRDLRFDLRYFSFFLIGLLSFVIIAYVANASTSWKGMSVIRKVWTCVWYLPVFLALSMGLSLHNTIAVLQGFAGKQTAFVRTPKFALGNIVSQQRIRTYYGAKLSLTTVLEGILALYFLLAIVFGVFFNEYAFLLFHILLTCGYGAIFLLTLWHKRR
jgi:cellulose synthase/poly-beta-1,6-N-acetylglucosamine synthase-like glycosyltransferase